MRVIKNGLEGQHCVAGEPQVSLPRLGPHCWPCCGPESYSAPLCTRPELEGTSMPLFMGVWTDEGLAVACQEVKRTGPSPFHWLLPVQPLLGLKVSHHGKGDENKIRNKVIPGTGSAFVKLQRTLKEAALKHPEVRT